MLTIFRRHLTKCKFSDRGRFHRHCNCPIAVEGRVHPEESMTGFSGTPTYYVQRANQKKKNPLSRGVASLGTGKELSLTRTRQKVLRATRTSFNEGHVNYEASVKSRKGVCCGQFFGVHSCEKNEIERFCVLAIIRSVRAVEQPE